MRALVKKKPKGDPKNWYVGLDLVEKKEPYTTKDRPVKIEVVSGGICGTDVGVYLGKESLGITLKKLKSEDVTLGHEFSGKIVEVSERKAKEYLARLLLNGDFKNKKVKKYISSKSVKNLAGRTDFVQFLRDNFYVAGEMHFTCGNCLQCTHGEEHVCKNTIGKGLHEDGAFANFMVMPANRIVLFEKGEIDPRIISFMDALGNAVHVAQSAEIKGKTVLVTGVGVQGLMSIACAKAMGAGRIYATDIVPKNHTGADKLGIARKLGASAVFDVGTMEGVVALKQRIMRDTDNTGVDVVFEMSGSYEAYKQIFQLIRMGGTLLLLGLPAGKMEVDFSTDIIFRGLTVKGIYGRRIWETWELMRKLLKAGLEKTLLDSGIITVELPLAEYDKGFKMLIQGDAIKVLLRPGAADFGDKSLKIRRYESRDQKSAYALHIKALSAAGTYQKGGSWDGDFKNLEKVYIKSGGDFFVGIMNRSLVAMGALKKLSKDKAEIKRMRVDPAFQRHGFGQQILERLEKRARELGFKMLELDVAALQENALKFYEKNGYKEWKRTQLGDLESIFYRKKL